MCMEKDQRYNVSGNELRVQNSALQCKCSMGMHNCAVVHPLSM